MDSDPELREIEPAEENPPEPRMRLLAAGARETEDPPKPDRPIDLREMLGAVALDRFEKLLLRRIPLLVAEDSGAVERKVARLLLDAEERSTDGTRERVRGTKLRDRLTERC